MTVDVVGSRKLVLDDIADLRAYERERPTLRPHVLALRRRRRVALGPVLSVAFENRDTVRYQVQEMARVEHLMTDADVQAELDAYNPLVPEPGQLCATVFVELTTEDEVREWLVRLVGIERSLAVRLADGSTVRSVVEADHAARLTRPDVTSAVHYVRFDLSPTEVAAVATGPVRLVADHPAYAAEVVLEAETVIEILADLGEWPVDPGVEGRDPVGEIAPGGPGATDPKLCDGRHEGVEDEG